MIINSIRFSYKFVINIKSVVSEKGTKQEANVGTKIMANTLGLSCVVQQNRSSTKILAITHGTTTNTGRPRIVIYLTSAESDTLR